MNGVTTVFCASTGALRPYTPVILPRRDDAHSPGVIYFPDLRLRAINSPTWWHDRVTKYFRG